MSHILIIIIGNRADEEAALICKPDSDTEDTAGLQAPANSADMYVQATITVPATIRNQRTISLGPRNKQRREPCPPLVIGHIFSTKMYAGRIH